MWGEAGAESTLQPGSRSPGGNGDAEMPGTMSPAPPGHGHPGATNNAPPRLLLAGEVNDNALLGALELEESGLLGGCDAPGPLFPRKPRFSSESSSRSRLSSMTLDSEDSFYQSGAFEDSAAESLSRQSSVDDDCFFPRDVEGAAGRSSLRRNRSISLASSGSMSPLWEGSSSSSFGTLPRKSRRPSVRKHLLKFIPGLHRAVEEEESRV